MKDRRTLRPAISYDWFQISRRTALDDCTDRFEGLSQLSGCLRGNRVPDDFGNALLEGSSIGDIDPKHVS